MFTETKQCMWVHSVDNVSVVAAMFVTSHFSGSLDSWQFIKRKAFWKHMANGGDWKKKIL